MSFFRCFSYFLMTCSLLVFGTVVQGKGSKESGLRFAQTSVDIGFIFSTNIVHQTFPFEVTGSNEVSIIKTASNCGCFVATAEKKIYKIGENGIVNLSLNPNPLAAIF